MVLICTPIKFLFGSWCSLYPTLYKFSSIIFYTNTLLTLIILLRMDAWLRHPCHQLWCICMHQFQIPFCRECPFPDSKMVQEISSNVVLCQRTYFYHHCWGMCWINITFAMQIVSLCFLIVVPIIDKILLLHKQLNTRDIVCWIN